MCTVRCSGHLLEGGGVCPGGVCPGVSAWEMSAQGVSAQGVCPGECLPGGSAGVVGECLPGEVSTQGVYPGGVCIFVNVDLSLAISMEIVTFYWFSSIFRSQNKEKNIEVFQIFS